jgi:anti-anti-sigma factor
MRELPGRVLLAVLPEEIDLSNADALRDAVLAAAQAPAARTAPPDVLVLDLTGTEFMDSQGARLVEDLRRLLAPHTRVRVAARPHGSPGRVLELTRVRRDVPVCDSLAEALL